MKALLVVESLTAGKLDLSNTLIVVPSAQNLAICPFDLEVLAHKNFNLTDDCQVIKEIDIPEELVEVALELVQAEENIKKHIPAFKALCA